MKIIIESEPKEVAALILAIQERQIPTNVLELAEDVGESLKANSAAPKIKGVKVSIDH